MRRGDGERPSLSILQQRLLGEHPNPAVESAVDDLIHRFVSRKVPYFWWSGPVNHDEQVAGILEKRGFVKAFEAAAMGLSLSSRPAPKPVQSEVVESIRKTKLLIGTAYAQTHSALMMPSPAGGTSCSPVSRLVIQHRCVIFSRVSTASLLARRPCPSKMVSLVWPVSGSLIRIQRCRASTWPFKWGKRSHGTLTVKSTSARCICTRRSSSKKALSIRDSSFAQPLPACRVFCDFEWVESTQRVMIPDKKRGSIQDMEIGGFARH